MFSLVSVCLSSCLFTGEGSPCDHYLDLFKLVHLDLSSHHPGHVRTWSLIPHHTGTSLPNPRNQWKADAWPSTEMPSCLVQLHSGLDQTVLVPPTGIPKVWAHSRFTRNHYIFFGNVPCSVDQVDGSSGFQSPCPSFPDTLL